MARIVACGLFLQKKMDERIELLLSHFLRNAGRRLRIGWRERVGHLVGPIASQVERGGWIDIVIDDGAQKMREGVTIGTDRSTPLNRIEFYIEVRERAWDRRPCSANSLMGVRICVPARKQAKHPQAAVAMTVLPQVVSVSGSFCPS